MKKLLLATSILAGSAGVAAAEVSFSGSAFMGLSNEFTLGSDFQFFTRARVAISMSGETDGGLSFGASFDMHNAFGASDNQFNNGQAKVYLSGSFGKITFGDVGSASDGLIGNVSGVGVDLPGYQELGGYGENDKTAVRYEYSADAWGVMVGVGQLGNSPEADYSIAGKYTFGGSYTVYLGYDSEDDGLASTVTIGLDATFGDATIKVRADKLDDVVDSNAAAISLDYKFGAATATAFYKMVDLSVGADTSAYGVGVAYDLGGGATFKFGAEDNDLAGTDPLIDVGLKFSF